MSTQNMVLHNGIEILIARTVQAEQKHLLEARGYTVTITIQRQTG